MKLPCDLRLRVAWGFGATVVDVVEDGDVGADDDAVKDAADAAGAGVDSRINSDGITGVATAAATGMIFGGDSLVVFLAAGAALDLVAGLAFMTGLGVDLVLDFSLVFGRWALGLALGRWEGAGVLRLDFMGCV